MQWNELDYSLQQKVIDRIVDILKDENDSLMQDGIMAAVHELEIWSNTPCTIDEEPMVAKAYFEDQDDYNYRKSGNEG
jgi:hypothetical protein